MGWSCGQFWSYASDYWHDSGVAQCRRSEARAVCHELFGIGEGALGQKQNIRQDNTGVNLFTLNAFGQEHEVSHLGFFISLLVITLVCVAAYVTRKRFRRMAKALREAGLRLPRRISPWQRAAEEYTPNTDNFRDNRSHVVRFDPNQLTQIRGMLAPIRDREFYEVRQGLGVSRASARRPGEEEPEAEVSTEVLRPRSTPINRV